MKLLLLAVMLLSACKPLVSRGIRTDEAAFVCVEKSLAVQMAAAEQNGDHGMVKALARNGCFALPPQLEVKVLQTEGAFVLVDIHKLGLMRLAPGMEKVKSVQGWLHKSHLSGL